MSDVYVMPEGALYWYGNECTDKSGGWTLVTSGGYYGGAASKETNFVYLKPITTTYKDRSGMSINKSQEKNGFTKLCAKFEVDTSRTSSEGVRLREMSDTNVSQEYMGTELALAYSHGNNITSLELTLVDADNFYASISAHHQYSKIYGIWLE